MNIVKDHKKLSNTSNKMTFEFMPDTLVHTPEDFTKALCEYGMEHDLNLVVTEPGMYPKFELDGLEYQAARHTGRYGHVIYCQITDPELLQQECKEIATGHKHILSCIYSGIKILTIPVFLLIIIYAANPVFAVTAFLFFLLIEIICFLLSRKKENI